MNRVMEQHLIRRKRRWSAFVRHVRRQTAPAQLEAPSFHDDGVAASQEPIDALEEASMESFPASDPPAVHRI